MAECCVRNCGRRAQADNEFCLKCWTLLTEDERAGYQFARHAPFWSHWALSRRIEVNGEWMWVTEVDDDETFKMTDPSQPDGSFRHIMHRGVASIEFLDTTTGKRAAALHHGTMLRELEHRTTRDAIAAALWDRKWRESIIGSTAPTESP